MLKIDDIQKIEPFYTSLIHGKVVNMEVKEFSYSKKEILLEYEDGVKFTGNLKDKNFKLTPVLGMTSVVENFARGKYGNSKYRGNCSGLPFKDLFDFYKVEEVYDCMCGSKTIEDVCVEQGIQCTSTDLNPAYGGVDVYKDGLIQRIGGKGKRAAVTAHFPYFSPTGCAMPKYSGKEWGKEPHPSDGSWIPNYQKFMKWVNDCYANMYSDAEKGTYFMFLIGDTRYKGKYYSMLEGLNKYGELKNIIVKKQYNCMSESTNYAGKFIPIVHEYFVVLQKTDNFIVPCRIVSYMTYDPQKVILDKGVECLKDRTWKGIISYVINKLGAATREEIYQYIVDSRDPKLFNDENVKKKLKSNNTIDATIRKITNTYKVFLKDGNKYSLAVA